MKTPVFPARLALLSCALASAFPASSQPASLATELNDVVVTASRTEQRAREALPATTLISRADIERSQVADLPALLRTVTGVEITQSGGAGTVSSAFLRGAESRHTLVLIDGVPANNLNFGTAAIEHLSLANVERIEVVRGNVSSLYGSAALGGVIQIFTREAAGKPWSDVSVQAGSRGVANLQAGAGVRLASGTLLSASVETRRDEGFNAIDQSRHADTNPDRDGYSRRTIAAGLHQELGSGRLGLALRESRGTTRYDSQFGPANQPDESRFLLRSASLSGQFRPAPGFTLDATLTHSSDEQDAAVTASPYFVNSGLKSAVLGMNWKPAAGHQWTAGVESSHQELESDTAYAADARRLKSARVGYQLDSGRHQLQLNVRHDDYSDFGSARTWLAAYGLRLSPAWRLHASLSTGFTAPTFNDLYFPWGGNADLQPERARSRELGLTHSAGGQEFRLTVFDNRYRDLIGDDAAWVRTNISSARNKGAEIGYEGRFDTTTLRACATVQDPVNLATGQRLSRRAARLLNLGVTQQWGAWEVGGELRHTGERPDGARTLASHTLLDLSAGYRVSKELRLFGRIENATDRQYETVYGYRQAARGVFIGLNWQPGR